MRVRVGTFNVLNLVLPDRPYYQERPYSRGEYDRKLEWIGGQLRRMDPHIVGFQEVFHEAALREAVTRSGLFTPEQAIAPLAADANTGPQVGIASRLPFLEQPEAVADFPPEVTVGVEGVAMPVRRFSRPVLRARIDLGAGRAVTVLVAHLKSKRPILDPTKPQDDPIEQALGQARALLVRAAEAAALRALVVAGTRGTREPVIVLGDLNDGASAVSTEIVAGQEPWRYWRIDRKRTVWDVLLYSTYHIQARQDDRDVSFSHIYNGHHDTLDHILVSEEFFKLNPNAIGEVEYLRFFNDHLVDSTLTDMREDRTISDHGQVVATLRLKEASGPG